MDNNGQGYRATDPLIDELNNLLDGSQPEPQITRALEEKRSQLQAFRQRLEKTISLEPEAVRDYCSETLDSIAKCFEEYETFLQDLQTAVNTRNEEALRGAPEHILDLNEKLNLVFMQFRNDALIARGPSSHAGINLIINGIHLILRGENVREDLKRDIFIEANLAREAARTLTKPGNYFLKDKLKDFYIQYEEMLRRFDGYFITGADFMLAMVQKDLEDLGETYRRIDLSYHITRLSKTPTSLPALNLVINTGNNLINDTADRDMYQYFLDELWNLTNSVRQYFDDLTGKTEAPTGIEAEETEKLHCSLQGITESLEGFDLLLSGDEEAFKTAESKAIASAETFAAAVSNMMALSQQERTVACFRCGHANPAGTIVCSRCKMVLPRSEEPEPQSVFSRSDIGGPVTGGEGTVQMTTFVQDLLETANGVAEGVMEVSDLLAVIKEMDQRVRSAFRSAKAVPMLPPDLVRDIGEESAQELKALLKELSLDYKDGLDMFDIGLRRYIDFCQSRSVADLEEAESIIMESMEILQQTQRTLGILTGQQ